MLIIGLKFKLKMNDFGVLVRSYSIKPQGKSFPMASIKRTRATYKYTNKSINLDPSSFTTNYAHNTNSESGSFVIMQMIIFLGSILENHFRSLQVLILWCA